jgi:acyl-CoA reductase-like NAD-dependent aldehyde dehydrogenase
VIPASLSTFRTSRKGDAVSAKFKTTNPATGEVLKEFPTAGDEEISAVIDASDAAFQTWRTTDVRDRTAPARASGGPHGRAQVRPR